MPPTLTDQDFNAHRWIPLHEAVTDRTGPELQRIIANGDFPPTAYYRAMEYVRHDHITRWYLSGYGRRLHEMGASVDPETGAMRPRNHK